MKNRKLNITLSVIVVAIFIWLPIIPVDVVPEVTLKVINENNQLMTGIKIVQGWQHWTFESEDHRDEKTSDANGSVTFSEKSIKVSVFKFLFWRLMEIVMKINPHAGFGPSTGLWAEGYKSENKWCYPPEKCLNREITREIIIKEKIQ